MSGVIDENGQQWEHCSHCSRWVKIQNLRYEQPSPKHEYGRGLCNRCYRITQIVEIRLQPVPFRAPEAVRFQ